jgi:parvulin-like peptidyl-prolyl isomerase
LQSIREQLATQYSDRAVADKEFGTVSKRALKNLIENKLMLQKAEEVGLTANIESDLVGAIENVRKESGIPDMKMFEQALQQQGMTLQDYRETLRKRLLFDRLINRFVQSKVMVMDSEINQYYQTHQEKFTRPAEVDVSEIVVLFEGKQKAAAQSKAEQALAELKGGQSFADVAKKYSEGATAAKGGGVGSFKQGTLAPALEKAVFNLKPDQFVGPVETNYGLVLMRLNKKTEAAPVALADVRPEIQREIYYSKMQPELAKFAETLRLQSYVYISPKYKEQYPVD